jgi:alpha-L-fucosidase
LVHENDEEQLMGLRTQIDADFAKELAQTANVKATNVRGNSKTYDPINLIDGNNNTYWSTDDGVFTASVTLSFSEPTEINRVVLQEYIPLGQRIKKFSVEAKVADKWIQIDTQTTIGYKRILRFNTLKTGALRIHILESKGVPVISNLEIYRAPNLLVQPTIERNKEGLVSLTVPEEVVDVYYTLDGSEPNTSSVKYKTPFLISKPTTLKAIAYDIESGNQSESISRHIDISKKDWKVVSTTSGAQEHIQNLIDENPETFWATNNKKAKTQEVSIDLGANYLLNGFTYWPSQERYPFGIITDYAFYTSMDGLRWDVVNKGEFSNVVNSRLQQKVLFKETKARYVKIAAVKTSGQDPRASFAEIGVLTSE